MTEDFAADNERRKSRRFKISAPVTVMAGGTEISAYTRDVSNRGIYLLLTSSESEQVDSEFDFMLEIPPEITHATSCRIRCRGRLLRREDAIRNLAGAGIAAEIVSYSILDEGERQPV